MARNITERHRNAISRANTKNRKVIIIPLEYDDMENAFDYSKEFNSTKEMIDYFIENKLSFTTNKHTLLVNARNVAKGISTGLDRSLCNYRIYIEGINFVVDEEGNFVGI